MFLKELLQKMNYKLIIRPEAEYDLEETFLWYEGKRKGLGYDFLLQVLPESDQNRLLFPLLRHHSYMVTPPG